MVSLSSFTSGRSKLLSGGSWLKRVRRRVIGGNGFVTCGSGFIKDGIK